MAAATAAAWAAVALTAYSVSEQYSAGERAKKAASQSAQAQKESIAAQGRISEVEAQRSRIAQNREARIRRAQILASTGSASEGTSGVSGAVSSIVSQESSNIGSIGQTQTFAQAASAANQRGADAQSNMAKAQAEGQQWGAIGGLASPFLPKAFETIFTKRS